MKMTTTDHTDHTDENQQEKAGMPAGIPYPCDPCDPWLIFLIGYRGTGKTTVAQLLAEQLGWEAVDADVVLEARAGRSIRQIFAGEGGAGCRRRGAALLD